MQAKLQNGTHLHALTLSPSNHVNCGNAGQHLHDYIANMELQQGARTELEWHKTADLECTTHKEKSNIRQRDC